MSGPHHTPGPWTAVPVVDEDRTDPVVLWGIEGPLGPMTTGVFGLEGDARLAAAAPVMYDALVDIGKYTEDPAGDVQAGAAREADGGGSLAADWR